MVGEGDREVIKWELEERTCRKQEGRGGGELGGRWWRKEVSSASCISAFWRESVLSPPLTSCVLQVGEGLCDCFPSLPPFFPHVFSTIPHSSPVCSFPPLVLPPHQSEGIFRVAAHLTAESEAEVRRKLSNGVLPEELGVHDLAFLVKVRQGVREREREGEREREWVWER